MDQRAGYRAIIRDNQEQPPPEFTAGLKHPWFEVEMIGGSENTRAGLIIERAETMKADQICSAFDEFLGKQLPISRSSNNDEFVPAPFNPAQTHDAGPKHCARGISGGREVSSFL